MGPLKEGLPVETSKADAAWAAFEAATEVLIRKHDLPRQHQLFVKELRRRLEEEDIQEGPDVILWESLYSAVREWPCPRFHGRSAPHGW